MLFATGLVLFAGILTFSILMFLPKKTTLADRETLAPVVGMSSGLLSIGAPTRLSIPSIKVNTDVVPTGVKADGTMDIAEDPDRVGWYQFGARPGDEGSAVIAGHYGWTGTHGSIFNNLHQLSAGDEVLVSDADGATVTFVVREMRLYDPTADAAAIFRSYDGKAHLNLITCDGAWVNEKDSYSERLVVFTDLKS